MSGSLDVHGFIGDWPSLEGYLFDVNNQSSASSEGDDWKWEDEEDDEGEEVSSPTSGSGSREWDAQSGRSKYIKIFEGNLSQEGETITSALCIPLVSNKKSSPGAPDWTCVVIGFSDGYVRMYTESGSTLISQMFHDQPVTSFKCRSYKAAMSQNEHDQLEEVFIMYATVLVTIDGFGLFQTLRGCRSRIARVQANAAESMADPPPLSYKKWQYESEGVSDCESVGVVTPNTFDHLLTASIIGGIGAKPNKVPYTSTVFATIGRKPYVSFHYAQEGQAPFMIGKLAYSVANKLTNSLINAASGWLGFGGGGNSAKPAVPQSKQEKPKIESATPMAGRFGLPDKGRKGKSIIISPCHKLSAITDTLGRVVLMDNERGIAVRMWKGYRDAQTAWFPVSDDMNAKTRVSGRKALFLVIYAPRKGQLEIFSMQQGPKVGSFPVSKSGRLIGLAYGMMGLSNIPLKSVNQQALSCLFLDPEGLLHQLHIPFHLALNDANNSKLKDMHLLKTLQRMLRDSLQCSADEINRLIYDIKTQSMINQAFKILIQYCKQHEVMASVLEGYLEKFCEDEQYDLTVPFKIQSLLQLYSYLVNSMEPPPPYSREEGSSSSDNTVLMCLHATDKEIKLIKDMANKELFNKSSPSKGVSFADDTAVLNVNDFLSLFHIEFDPAKIKATLPHESKMHINLKNDNILNFGKLVFCGCFNSNSDLKQWKTLLKSCDLVPLELMLETLKFWCNNALVSSSFIDMLGKLYHVIRAICDLEGMASTVNVSSTWWDTIRKEIAQGYKIFYNYTFATVCRAVTIDLNCEVEKNDEDIKIKNAKADLTNPDLDIAVEASISEMEVDELDVENWENVTLDSIRWNILLKQIEDLSFLSTILTQTPQLSTPTLPRLHSTIKDLSVVSLLDRGTGCIADLVGSWLTTLGVDPSVIVDNSEISVPQSQVAPEYTEKEMKQKHKLELQQMDNKMEIDEEKKLEDSTNAGSEISYIVELLRCLKDNFTNSLNSSIILSNYCWEYCLAWNKEVDNVEYLLAAIHCVTVIPSNFTKQGLMSMMWSTFISKQLANIVARGKIKREKVLEKTSVINTPESKVAFLNACAKFLDEFMENNVLCQGVPPVPKTQSKKSHWSADSSVSASLAELALSQPLANYEMILLHYQLSLSALFVHSFGIRKTSMKPMNLFDTKASMIFFTAISNPAPYSNNAVDLALKVLREEFLCLVVTSVIGKVPEDLNNSMEVEAESYISPSPHGVKDCENWIHKCFELGRIWGLDLDSLRINQVCEFYSSGFDLLGLESVGTVAAKDILGSKLLVIAGMRLHYHIESNRDSTTEIVSSMSTSLSNWLNKLDYSKLRCLRFPKSSIAELCQHIIHLIPETSYDYRLADDLLVCSSFLTS